MLEAITTRPQVTWAQRLNGLDPKRREEIYFCPCKRLRLRRLGPQPRPFREVPRRLEPAPHPNKTPHSTPVSSRTVSTVRDLLLLCMGQPPSTASQLFTPVILSEGARPSRDCQCHLRSTAPRRGTQNRLVLNDSATGISLAPNAIRVYGGTLNV